MPTPLRKVGDYRLTVSSLRGSSLGIAAEKYAALKLTSGRWRPSSGQTYRHAMRQVLGIIGDKPVIGITMEDMEIVWLTLCGKELSPQWINRVRGCLCGLFRWLLRHRAIELDPMAIWELMEIGDDEHLRVFHDFTPAEVQQLTAKARPVIWKAIWLICYTGLRRANLCGMRWNWIDEGWVCEIPASKFKQDRPHRFPLHPVLHDILLPRGRPEDPVLQGLPSPCRFTHHLKDLAKRTGLPIEWVYPHNFRRTFCAWLHKAGIRREEAMELLGSRSETILVRHYWPEETDEEKWEIINRLK